MNLIFISDTYFLLNDTMVDAITKIVFFPMMYTGYQLSHLCAYWEVYDLMWMKFHLPYMITYNSLYVFGFFLWSPIYYKIIVKFTKE